jgi:molybdopterin-dependent oxidoreductase alpha subunit
MLRKPARFWRPSLWASLRPFGLGLERPNNFAEVFRAFRENKGARRYALRILKQGVCDGCALGTTGMRDWTQSGLHLCNIRLRLLRLNTLPAFSPGLLADVSRPLLTDTPKRRLRDLGRIPTPLIRRHGDPGFTPISWDDALALAADRVAATTPDRLGFYLTARGLPNETYYTVQKAIRALGTNNLDNAARICHAPSTYALKDALGVGASTCSYADWIGTDLVVFFGSNVANNQPVSTKYLYLARKAGTRVAVVNTYREPGLERYWIPSVVESALFGTKLATDFFQVGTGGDIAFIAGAMKHMVISNLVDADFIARHGAGFEALATTLAAYDWADLERRSSATRAEMERFGALVGAAKRAVFVWSMGMTQHTFGEDAVRQVINLGLMRGFIGEEGSGMMPIRGHSGVQGGAEMGAYATAFPGGLPIDATRAKALEARWGFPVPAAPGLTMPEMLDRADDGRLDVLWSVGGNFIDVMPDPKGVERALGKIPLRVHQDLVLTRQMFVPPPPGGAVLLLPATTRYEVPGGVTQTSTERRVIFSPEIPGPRIRDARWEGDVLLELARRVRPEYAARLTFPDTAAIRREIADVVPFYAGIERLARQGDQFQYGGRLLCANKTFATPDGRAHFGVVPLPDPRVPPGHFIVATRRGKQFNSIIHADIDRLNGARRDHILVSPADADRLGLEDNARITLKSPFGSYSGRLRRAPIATGSLQVHWPEGNALLDPKRRSRVSGIPDYNAVATLERAP